MSRQYEEEKKKKARWSYIGREAWTLARKAYQLYKEDGEKASTYIWEEVEKYNWSSYELGVFGEWACEDYDKICANPSGESDHE